MVVRGRHRPRTTTPVPVAHKEDAEDAVSEAVVSAYGQISGLRNPEAFRPWMFKILSNICRRTLKSYTRKNGELTEEIPDPGRDFTEDLDIHLAFSRLTDEERLILSLHIFAGYTSRETAEILRMKDATVRSKESRALARLQGGEASK